MIKGIYEAIFWATFGFFLGGLKLSGILIGLLWGLGINATANILPRNRALEDN